MPRTNAVSVEIHRRHIRLYRYLNDSWIFTQLIRPKICEEKERLAFSASRKKKAYNVPTGASFAVSKRRDSDIAEIFGLQHDRGIFETLITAIVSRVEIFIQECMRVAIAHHPHKLSALVDDKSGIPIDIFLRHNNRDDVLSEFIAMKCEGYIHGPPNKYLERLCTILAINLEHDLLDSYIEIKATRDIIAHNSSIINRVYMTKSPRKARGRPGDVLPVDEQYFRHVIVVAKSLSASINREVESVYG